MASTPRATVDFEALNLPQGDELEKNGVNTVTLGSALDRVRMLSACPLSSGFSCPQRLTRYAAKSYTSPNPLILPGLMHSFKWKELLVRWGIFRCRNPFIKWTKGTERKGDSIWSVARSPSLLDTQKIFILCCGKITSLALFHAQT